MSSFPLSNLVGDTVADAKLRRVARKFRAVMEELGLDMGDPHLEGTELRVARAYRELFAGLGPARSLSFARFPTPSATPKS